MNLVKTSLLNGIAVIVKMLTLLSINKVLAVYVGPAGYAAIGQFQNAVQMITTFASGAINTGVTKYTAEYHESGEKQRAVWRTAGSIALGGSLLTGILLVLLRGPIALWVFKNEALSSIFIWVAASLVFLVFNSLLLAILNGKKDVRRYVIANVAGSLFALCVTLLLTVGHGLYGALVALASYQSLAFFVTLFLCWRADWFQLAFLIGRIDHSAALNLGKYTLMALTSAICVPISQLLVRNHIGLTLGWEAAGYWEAITRLSGAYLMMVTTTLGVYYLPRLSELVERQEIRREILHGYRLILPLVGLAALLMYLCRDLIIRLLFSAEFSPVRDIFAWQMLGDFFKIGSWIISYLLLSKAMYKTFIVTEVVFSLLFFVLVYLLTGFFGIVGVTMAYAVNYLIYWIAMGYIMRHRVMGSLAENE
ncbi:O-antigen translocase [Comamonas thiooxydans]|uniref:O-antigen translocase n=1 Tax=Comamonas thiooxydans TaxID=363952 RepID=A0AA42PXA7_9BURK|nr:O-antigen translocase [Comamonas thiooxydans]MDH1333220.1 O-antigen translocase [Comamonas thiooxydans]MDH1474565.1 O-antigen translocase [Comamonas thiooxydans]MDH1739007.1 O-antigen translocase [Comamonas thiooxydans]MDH1786090.1 O-antigen translocase [Comamonas thiooxydans]